MHPRNPYRDGVDFASLASKNAPLRPYVNPRTGSIDFTDPEAQRALPRLEVELPEDRLCPPVPNRLNYVLWIEDIVQATRTSRARGLGLGEVKDEEEKDRESTVRGLDVCSGTGASAIYPLLCCTRNPTWQMLATEIDSTSLACAQRNVSANALDGRIHVSLATAPSSSSSSPSSSESSASSPHTSHSPTSAPSESESYGSPPSSKIFGPLFADPHLRVDFTMCNPPFYSSAGEIKSSKEEKDGDAFSVCTGSVGEMIYAPPPPSSSSLKTLDGGTRSDTLNACMSSSALDASMSSSTLDAGTSSNTLNTGMRSTKVVASSSHSYEGCEREGGEVGFVARMVEESLVIGERCAWYTSMLGKMSSVPKIVGLFKAVGITNYAITQFVQGQTRRWAVGWSVGRWRLPDSVARLSHFPSTHLLAKVQPARTTVEYILDKDPRQALRRVLEGMRVDGVLQVEEKRRGVLRVGGRRLSFPPKTMEEEEAKEDEAMEEETKEDKKMEEGEAKEDKTMEGGAKEDQTMEEEREGEREDDGVGRRKRGRVKRDRSKRRKGKGSVEGSKEAVGTRRYAHYSPFVFTTPSPSTPPCPLVQGQPGREALGGEEGSTTRISAAIRHALTEPIRPTPAPHLDSSNQHPLSTGVPPTSVSRKRNRNTRQAPDHIIDPSIHNPTLRSLKRPLLALIIPPIPRYFKFQSSPHLHQGKPAPTYPNSIASYVSDAQDVSCSLNPGMTERMMLRSTIQADDKPTLFPHLPLKAYPPPLPDAPLPLSIVSPLSGTWRGISLAVLTGQWVPRAACGTSALSLNHNRHRLGGRSFTSLRQESNSLACQSAQPTDQLEAPTASKTAPAQCASTVKYTEKDKFHFRSFNGLAKCSARLELPRQARLSKRSRHTHHLHPTDLALSSICLLPQVHGEGISDRRDGVVGTASRGRYAILTGVDADYSTAYTRLRWPEDSNSAEFKLYSDVAPSICNRPLNAGHPVGTAPSLYRMYGEPNVGKFRNALSGIGADKMTWHPYQALVWVRRPDQAERYPDKGEGGLPAPFGQKSPSNPPPRPTETPSINAGGSADLIVRPQIEIRS
ncbi:hypothetical protein NMY22_g16120 [Coprinellus aureogranulatus]|nr:hypothetical protein NMY22_g16120 [Coprinellus aureogranulatus]